MKFRKKPVVIEAYQLSPRNQDPNAAWWSDVAQWASDNEINTDDWIFRSKDGIEIPTLEGNHLASPYDWIIRGVKGECYPCKPDIFEATYEPVE